MRILIISDIHANLAAFEAVLADAEGEWEKIWCLGDLVGYGPSPDECVALLRQHDHLSLSGNHDWAVLGKLSLEDFNYEAQSASLWTREISRPETLAYLDALPPLQIEGQFTLAHASPRHPVWEYVTDPITAGANFEYFDTPYCLVGHSHIPVVFADIGMEYPLVQGPSYTKALELNDHRLIINPGSVGQPRDSDPRAAYALLDTETLRWQHRRIDYPVHETQELMRHFDFPPRLIERLQMGW